MGQYSVLESPESTSVDSFSGKSGSDDSRRIFTVAILSDPAFETSETVKIFSSLPKRGDIHPNNAAKVCTGTEVQQRGPLLYDAVSSYSSPQTISSPSGSLKPWEQPPDIKFGTATSQEKIDKDVSGKWMIMATGEVFDPQITKPYADLTITVVRNVIVFDAKRSSDMLWKVNSDGYLGFAPGQALLTQLEAEQLYYQPGKPTQTVYYRRTSTVQFRRPMNGIEPSKAWWHRQVAAGFQWYVPRDAVTKKPNRTATNHITLERAFDDNGQYSTKPLLHNKDTGFPLFSDNTTITYNPTNAQFYLFEIYEKTAFNGAPIL